jgi:hypothetical protein
MKKDLGVTEEGGKEGRKATTSTLSPSGGRSASLEHETAKSEKEGAT